MKLKEFSEIVAVAAANKPDVEVVIPNINITGTASSVTLAIFNDNWTAASYGNFLVVSSDLDAAAKAQNERLSKLNPLEQVAEFFHEVRSTDNNSPIKE